MKPSRDDPFVAVESFRMRLITALLNAAAVIVLVVFVLVVVLRHVG